MIGNGLGKFEGFYFLEFRLNLWVFDVENNFHKVSKKILKPIFLNFMLAFKAQGIIETVLTLEIHSISLSLSCLN